MNTQPSFWIILLETLDAGIEAGMERAHCLWLKGSGTLGGMLRAFWRGDCAEGRELARVYVSAKGRACDGGS